MLNLQNLKAMGILKLNATFDGDYVSKNGNATFRYVVSGKPDAIAAFESVQGDYYRENEDGKALWFTTRYAGDDATLIVNEDTGKVYPDMSEYRKQASLAAQFGGSLGDQLAKAAVSKLFGRKTDETPAEQSARPKSSVSSNPAGIGGL
jgi:hypothetical protein